MRISDTSSDVCSSDLTAISLYPGCDHRRMTCKDKCNNILNYGGFDKITGSIAAGKSADLIVLDKNICDVPVYEISDAKVVLTLFEGKPVSGGWARFGAAGKK